MRLALHGRLQTQHKILVFLESVVRQQRRGKRGEHHQLLKCRKCYNGK
jgi:hypothetical protein